MRVLVVGGGGREHALVWKLKQSPLVDRIFCAPGNGGIAADAECVPLKADDIDALADFAQREKIDLTVVGPEIPLVAGIADLFADRGLRVFGPCRQAALLEGSKAFAKEMMAKYRIPTARCRVFHDPGETLAYVRQLGGPCVVKADGLAAGKGVIVAASAEEAAEAVRVIGEDRAFGRAGDRILVEERLEGEEVSVLAFTDGRTVLPMVASQDHKRVFDGDRGPNTGGMGAYSPPPAYTPELQRQVVQTLLEPLIAGLNSEGISYRGVLYAGLMLTSQGPSVLEFNCRFGDPETQVVLPRLKSDLAEVMQAVIDRRLDRINLEWDSRAAVCVNLASGGYPGSYEKGKPIRGLDSLPAELLVFHAGTALLNGQIVTAGGRVLGVTGLGPTVRQAVDAAYGGVGKISFEGMHYRRDIAHHALSVSS